MPEVLLNLALYQPWECIKPKQFFIDLRSEERQQRDKVGISSTTLDKKLNLFAYRPKIVFCVEMVETTEPSMWHSE